MVMWKRLHHIPLCRVFCLAKIRLFAGICVGRSKHLDLFATVLDAIVSCVPIARLMVAVDGFCSLVSVACVSVGITADRGRQVVCWVTYTKKTRWLVWSQRVEIFCVKECCCRRRVSLCSTSAFYTACLLGGVPHAFTKHLRVCFPSCIIRYICPQSGRPAMPRSSIKQSALILRLKWLFLSISSSG